MENSEPNNVTDTPASLALEALNGTKPAATPADAPPATTPPVEEKPAPGDKPKPPSDEKPVTKEDIARMVKEGIEADRKATAGQREADSTRERFMREKMSDLPIWAQNTLPKTGDMKQLNTAAQEVRQQMTEWFKSNATRMGMKLPDIGGGSPTNGIPPMQSRDSSVKMTPTQLVHSALEGK